MTTPGSALVIAGGDLLVREGSQLRLEDSSLSISGGNMIIQDDATLRIRGGAELAVGQDAHVALEGDSALRLEGGNIEFNDSSVLSCTQSSLGVDGGNFRLFDAVDISFDQVSFSIRGGGFQASDTSRARLADSQLEVRGGEISLGGESALHIGGGSIILRDSSTITLNDRSSFSVTDGEVSLRRSQLGVKGNVRFAGQTLVELRNSELTVGEGGRLRIDEAASVLGIRSTLTVADGALSFADLASLDGACAGDVVISVSRGVTRAVCLRPTPNGGPDDTCQSKVDPETDQWVCEDVCVSDKGGQVCGTTNHF